MKILIVDSRITNKCESSLIKEGYTLLKLPKDKSLGEAVSSHPDTVLFRIENDLVTTADYCDCAPYIFNDIREYCQNIRVHFTSDERKDKYPYDCIMNALVIGKKLFCKTDTVSKTILQLANDKGYEIIHTSQGYPACMALTFGNNAITSDKGLASTMANNGVSVTLIDQGGISLPSYKYGFIGGASTVVGNKIYFFGDILNHPNGDLIYQIIKKTGFVPISLSDEALSDFGGAIAF